MTLQNLISHSTAMCFDICMPSPVSLSGVFCFYAILWPDTSLTVMWCWTDAGPDLASIGPEWGRYLTSSCGILDCTCPHCVRPGQWTGWGCRSGTSTPFIVPAVPCAYSSSLRATDFHIYSRKYCYKTGWNFPYKFQILHDAGSIRCWVGKKLRPWCYFAAYIRL